MSSIELPINMKPKIRTFSYYAFTHAIIDNDFYNGDVVARIAISQFNRYKWSSICESLDIKQEGNHLDFYADEFRMNMNACFFRSVEKDDEIQIKIDFQQYSQPWGAINVFLSDLSDEDMMNDDGYLCRMGFFNKKGVYVRTQNVEHNLRKRIVSLPVVLRIKKQKQQIFFFAGTDLPEAIFEYQLPDDCKDIKIGFQIKLNSNVYYDWLFSNHIQLLSDIHDYDCKLKYFYGTLKDYQYYTNNYFLNYNNVNVRDYKNFGISMSEFIKYNLSKHKYIETFLDHYYIEGQCEYGDKHHYHQFLIYGYDDYAQEFLILGYNTNGIIKKLTISYKGLRECENQNFNQNMLVVIEYEPDSRTYETNILYIARMIQDYVNGNNSGINISHLLTTETRQYGIMIYNELLTNKGLWLLTKDRRISFLLYEHKQCMAERVQFLKKKGYLSEEDSRELCEKAQELVTLSALIKNYAIKCMVTNKETEVQKMKEAIQTLRDKDFMFMNDFLESIIQHNNLKLT